MPKIVRLQQLTDDELVAALGQLAAQRNRVSAEFVAHIAELDARRLYAKHACSSTFAYCVERLHLSEAAACKLIAVARLARKLPRVLDMLHAGEIHKSGLVVLAPHLTDENHSELLDAAKHRSKRQIEALVAEWFPRPDVPSRIRKLPAPAPGRRAASAAPALRHGSGQAPGNAGAGAPPATNDTNGFVLTPPKPRPSKVEPLAPARFKVEFTADQKLYDKLEKAKALLGPRGSPDLAPLFDRALELLVADLEKKKYGKTSRPRRAKSKKTGGGRSRHVPNQVKREVAERDELQCTFVDKQGNRCQERWGLELHHEELFVAGGPHTAPNISLRCRAHNRYAAEQELGTGFIEDKIAAARAQAADPGERDRSPPP